MTQKTTLPGVFTGPLVGTLPKFVHSAPVTSGLVRRYAASTLNTAQVGSQVSTLADLTGNGGALTQSTAAQQPTLRQSGAIRYLEFIDDAMTADPSGGKSYAVVGRFRTLPTGSALFPLIQLGGFGDGALSANSGGTMTGYGTAGLTTNFGPGTGWHVFYASYVGTESVVQIDGNTATGNMGTTKATGTVLGRDLSNAPICPIDVSEVLVWNRALTAAERNKVVADLRANYGI